MAKHKLFSLRYWFFDLTKTTAAIPGLLWLRPKWIYESSKAKDRIRGCALLCANLQSLLDPIYLQFAVTYRRQRFVCLQSFFEKPVTKWLFTRFLCIPIDKGNPSLKTIREIGAALKEGWLVSVFPEGTIAGGASLQSFHSGVVLMASMGRCPLIPVYIRKKERFWQRMRIVIGEPITLAGEGKPGISEMEEVARELQKREERLEELCLGKRKS